MPFSHLHDHTFNARLFRTVANYTYDWESWHDPTGKPVWINEAVERMTGYSVQECLAMTDYPLPIVAESHRRRIRVMLDQAIAGQSHNDLEFEIETCGGEQRWMAVSWQSMFDDDREHLGFRTSVRDITDRRGLQEQLRVYTEHLEQMVQERTAKIAQLEKHRRQMEKMAALGELAAGVAHEVNNPLAGIRNAFALFRGSLPRDHEHFDLLELVDDEIERISTIVHQMYQLYRRSPQASSVVAMEKLLGGCVCLLEPIARRHRVTIEVRPQPTSHCAATMVCLPEGEVKQILFNLVRNAIQASASGQCVEIVVDATKDELELAIRDRGTGIAPEVLPHIFEPFFSTKGQIKEGMGLGLSVTRSLVESIRGSIDVDTQVGVGTTFTVRLPRRLETTTTTA